MGNHKDLIAYKKAFEVAMRIFHITKKFPVEEKYSMVDQIRRSSRSICVNIAEAYRKRAYRAHFLAKLSDADMENAETQTWLDFALGCAYIGKQDYEYCQQQLSEIGNLLNYMQNHPEKYLPKPI